MTLNIEPLDVDVSNLRPRLMRGLEALGIDVADDAQLRLVGATPSFVADGKTLATEIPAPVRRTGWRALLADSKEVIALVEIALLDDGPDVSIRGRSAAEAFAAALRLARGYAALEDSFEVRFLAAPDIYLSALWLDGPSALYIPTRLGTRPDVATLMVLDAALFRAAAARLVERRPPPAARADERAFAAIVHPPYSGFGLADPDPQDPGNP
jgi:hypothetical protein